MLRVRHPVAIVTHDVRIGYSKKIVTNDETCRPGVYSHVSGKAFNYVLGYSSQYEREIGNHTIEM